MIADDPQVWDAAPLNAVLAYKGGAKQAWDNTDLTGPWLNGMRNSLNSANLGLQGAELPLRISDPRHGPSGTLRPGYVG
jgi:hypothetical protein